MFEFLLLQKLFQHKKFKFHSLNDSVDGRKPSKSFTGSDFIQNSDPFFFKNPGPSSSVGSSIDSVLVVEGYWALKCQVFSVQKNCKTEGAKISH